MPDSPLARGAVDALIRRYAARLLTLALFAEADDYVERYRGQCDQDGRALVVRNGLGAPRQVATDAGPLLVRAPRVLDRRPGARFTSTILPTYARSTARLAVALPELALRGLIEDPRGTEAGDRALRLMLGPTSAGLPRGVGRQLGETWSAECAGWRQRSLAALRIGELWAGEVQASALGLDATSSTGVAGSTTSSNGRGVVGATPCRVDLLVLVGATADGTPEVLAISDAPRDDAGWWTRLFEDLRRRGLATPSLVTGDASLGIWAALDVVYPHAVQLPCRAPLETWSGRPVPPLDDLLAAAEHERRARRRRAEADGGGASHGTGTGRAASGMVPASADDALGASPPPARMERPPSRASQAAPPPRRVVAMGPSSAWLPGGGAAASAERCTLRAPIASGLRAGRDAFSPRMAGDGWVGAHEERA